MKLNIAIVEDEKEYAKIIYEYVQRYAHENAHIVEIDLFSDGDEITYEYNPKYDIILLDIEMKRLDGMSTAELIREYDEEVIIIFITNTARFAMKGYEVDAFNYLVKPVSYSMFSREMDRSIQRLRNKKAQYIMLPTQNGLRKFEMSEIYYIERTRYKLLFKTIDGDFLNKGTIKEMEEELEGKFHRCNNGLLVNLSHVKAVEGFTVVVGPFKLQISRPRRKGFLEAVTAFIGGFRP